MSHPEQRLLLCLGLLRLDLRRDPALWPRCPLAYNGPVSAPRLLTVLFTDLVGSTETVARLGPEAGPAWRLGHVDLLREALAGTGGREVQAFGDGLLVVFEAASAAVACAAAMQRRVARANARRDALAEAAVRIGLAKALLDELG